MGKTFPRSCKSFKLFEEAITWEKLWRKKTYIYDTVVKERGVSKRDITSTSEKCTYCGYRVTPFSYAEKEEMGEFKFYNFMEGLYSCSNDLSKFGYAWTLITVLIGILLWLIFG